MGDMNWIWIVLAIVLVIAVILWFVNKDKRKTNPYDFEDEEAKSHLASVSAATAATTFGNEMSSQNEKMALNAEGSKIHRHSDSSVIQTNEERIEVGERSVEATQDELVVSSDEKHIDLSAIASEKPGQEITEPIDSIEADRLSNVEPLRHTADETMAEDRLVTYQDLIGSENGLKGEKVAIEGRLASFFTENLEVPMAKALGSINADADDPSKLVALRFIVEGPEGLQVGDKVRLVGHMDGLKLSDKDLVPAMTVESIERV